MRESKTVVIAGRDRGTLESLAAVVIEHLGVEPRLQHIINGHADPLHGYLETPDILILDLAADWEEQLAAICTRPGPARPAMLVVGPGTDVRAMRLAMRAGARDYLSAPAEATELRQALTLIEQETEQRDAIPAHWTSVIGSKGGVGASMIACNLAELIHQMGKRTTLLDLNIQGGSLAGYLDLEPRNSFFDAIEAADDLDHMALDGYMTKTSQGLRLLASPAEQVVLPEQVSAESMSTVFDLVTTAADYVVADVSRHLDHISAAAIELSDDILVVTEQSVAALRETMRILDVLTHEFAVAGSHIRVVINRCNKNAAVSERQLRKNLGEQEIVTIPNDYRAVSNSLDVGEPLVRQTRHSAVVKSLTKLGAELTGTSMSRNSLVSSLTGILRS